MPTTRSSASSTAATTSSAASELADLLANSQSSTIYLDADMSEDDAAALLLGDPPLHAEHDAVRDKWAVRKATDEEVAEAHAAQESSTSSSASTGSSASSSSTSTSA